MSEQTELDLGIGSKELEKLQATKVKIVKIEVRDVKKYKKTVLTSKHPDQEETIEISRVKFLKDGKVNASGLWITKDEEGKIQKGSPLAIFLEFYKAKSLKELEGKELDTIVEDSGYLCFKAY